MKVHAFRLTEGKDLRKGIEDYCQKQQITSGCIVTCVGCVKELHLRLAQAENFIHLKEDYEIVSLTGTVSANGSHMHFSGSDCNGMTLGGHLTYGTIIHTTAEIVLMEMEEYDFTREMDEHTGYQELLIVKK